MGLNAKLKKEIIGRIKRAAKPDRIILFGSSARGRMNAQSDIDLLVLKKNVVQPLKESVPIYDALIGLGFPFDVILMATERFEESKNVIG